MGTDSVAGELPILRKLAFAVREHYHKEHKVKYECKATPYFTLRTSNFNIMKTYLPHLPKDPFFQGPTTLRVENTHLHFWNMKAEYLLRRPGIWGVSPAGWSESGIPFRKGCVKDVGFVNILKTEEKNIE
ncbi:hypothetical protein CEXT_743351 [Caerostris extrusa]|uniref:Uncharacterized protein n=1 Tax=Caerostris extrusa TaxID=172846 RepID=A0AAV4VTF0_CAEEX|nr:hypothetical protein CEXT_743351 [Caerostris extrusa]